MLLLYMFLTTLHVRRLVDVLDNARRGGNGMQEVRSGFPHSQHFAC